MGGAYFAYRTYQQSRPGPIWVPLVVKSDLPKEERDRICKDLRDRLSDEELLARVSRDLGLVQTWGLASEREAVAMLREKLFVRTGTAQTKMGDVSAIHVGLNGTQKEKGMTEKIVMRLMEDVKTMSAPPPSSGEFGE